MIFHLLYNLTYLSGMWKKHQLEPCCSLAGSMIKKLRHTLPKISITKIHFKNTLFIYFNFPTHNTKLP